MPQATTPSKLLMLMSAPNRRARKVTLPCPVECPLTKLPQKHSPIETHSYMMPSGVGLCGLYVRSIKLCFPRESQRAREGIAMFLGCDCDYLSTPYQKWRLRSRQSGASIAEGGSDVPRFLDNGVEIHMPWAPRPLAQRRLPRSFARPHGLPAPSPPPHPLPAPPANPRYPPRGLGEATPSAAVRPRRRLPRRSPRGRVRGSDDLGGRLASSLRGGGAAATARPTETSLATRARRSRPRKRPRRREKRDSSFRGKEGRGGRTSTMSPPRRHAAVRGG